MTEYPVSRATKFDSESNFLVYVSYLALALLLVSLPGFYIYAGFKDNIDDVQLFWLSEDELEYTEKDSSIQCALLDNEWRTYRFPINANPLSISKLRLDFVREFSVAATVEVRAIQAATVDMGNASSVKIANAECVACRVNQHPDLLSIDQIEFDPYVQFSVVPSLMAATEFVQLEMRIMPRRINPINWFTRKAETNTFNSACRLANIVDD